MEKDGWRGRIELGRMRVNEEVKWQPSRPRD